ncbi:MAG: MerR family transcriptional regulator [Anaerolineales bacterium]|nr:MerR family transcriptional regulator [Anaerolineales bacterium]
MFQIGEFSKLGQVSPRMLRHYDQLGLLKPGQVDKWTGYRYYTIDQLAQLHRIIALKEMGLTLEQIGDLLKSGEALHPERLRGMLTLARSQIEREIYENQERLHRVEVRLQQIEEGPSPYEIVVKPIPAQVIASIREVVPRVQDMNAYCDTLYLELYAGLRSLGITPLQPEITLYHQDEYSETDLDAEFAIAVHPKHLKTPPAHRRIQFRELPAHPTAAALIYEGPFRDMLDAVLSLVKWVAMNGHTFDGPLRELHLSGPAHDADDGDTLPVTELQLPIRKLTP